MQGAGCKVQGTGYKVQGVYYVHLNPEPFTLHPVPCTLHLAPCTLNPKTMINWILANYIEILGTITGIIYVYLSIKQNIWSWFFGIINSLLYIYINFSAELYANMNLQVYYVIISVYGWYHWLYGAKEIGEKELPVSTTTFRLSMWLSLVTLALFVFLIFFLKRFTQSQLPMVDALTTAASIVATWMLTRKLIEQWIIWVVVDVISIGMYIYLQLYATSILFTVYTILAISGYYQWKKYLSKNQTIVSKL